MKKGETASTKLMCCGESTGTPISDCHSAGEASAAQPPLSACTAEAAAPWLAWLTHTHRAGLDNAEPPGREKSWPDGSGQALTAAGLPAGEVKFTE